MIEECFSPPHVVHGGPVVRDTSVGCGQVGHSGAVLCHTLATPPRQNPRVPWVTVSLAENTPLSAYLKARVDCVVQCDR